ncbi:hypothetical protein CC86DRAFT_95576 [Ophiobolus disseminans]|uniref:Extracellular membrane protein CFEM domain-containing protein n=1 Tax=Ophiobolus disseminans TaxID=1469910 RepID=A0A6A6ZPC6_9PLEO|nr:hypothetical protein CC86DRAFT_95576 [Ophiobolus disseminans]
MYASLRTALLTLALLSTVSAVQLANFQNVKIDNAQCKAAYTTNIEGCQASDFEPQGSAKCTEACVAGLKKIGEVVKRVCKDVDLGDASIIGVFKLDLGVAALCPRLASATSSAKAPEKSSAAAPPASSKVQSSAAAVQSSTLVTSSASTTTTAASASASQSDVAEASSSSSQGLLVDPSATSIAVAPTTVIPPSSSTKAASPSRAANAQLSNADSGGGSPFDVQAVTGASSQLRVFEWTMAAFVGTALLFGICA